MNKAKASGVITNSNYSHSFRDERFYSAIICSKRNSGVDDMIPLIMPESIYQRYSEISDGVRIGVIGEFRSYNKVIDGRSHLLLSLFVKDFYDPLEETDENYISVDGFICKESINRTTPRGRKICDIMVASNRGYKKSDYFPCVAWGQLATVTSTLKVGDPISFDGRIQSRVYHKINDDGTTTDKTAYEISVNNLNISDEELFEDLDSPIEEEV